MKRHAEVLSILADMCSPVNAKGGRVPDTNNVGFEILCALPQTFQTRQ